MTLSWRPVPESRRVVDAAGGVVAGGQDSLGTRLTLRLVYNGHRGRMGTKMWVAPQQSEPRPRHCRTGLRWRTRRRLWLQPSGNGCRRVNCLRESSRESMSSAIPNRNKTPLRSFYPAHFARRRLIGDVILADSPDTSNEPGLPSTRTTHRPTTPSWTAAYLLDAVCSFRGSSEDHAPNCPASRRHPCG